MSLWGKRALPESADLKINWAKVEAELERWNAMSPEEQLAETQARENSPEMKARLAPFNTKPRRCPCCGR